MKYPTLRQAGALLASLFGLASPAAAQFYTAPHGPGGTWNLYEVTNATATWKAAHLASIARTAAATGVSGVAADTRTGHLIAMNTWQENSMASMIAIRHTNSSNVWIGLTDSDDTDLGGAGWADAVASKTSGQWFWAGTTGGTGPGTLPNKALTLTDTGYNGFSILEPNNSVAAQTQGEDAVELRTDGKWNDNAHTATGTVRRYIIEWDVNSPTPIAGATVLSPLYTAPYGTNGAWNLYMMVGESDTFADAHARAIATTAQSTGLLSMAGNTTPGHILQVSSRTENSFGVAMANRLLRNNSLIAASDALSNLWIGLTDSEDYGAVEAGTSKETNWIWAGTTGGAGPGGQQRIEDTLDTPNATVSQFFNAAEPGNTVSASYAFGEDAVELRGDGRWQDNAHKTGDANAVTVRRYVIEWDINALGPIAGAEQHSFYYTARHGAGNTWNLYYLDYTQLPWQSLADRLADSAFGNASATKIPALAGNTTQGHLVEIADAYEHGSVYRMAYFGATWIGLTDSELYGGEESGNASNNPLKQIQPNWVWSGIPSPSTYRRWNAGEPNNSGEEDAAEMNANGVYNDLAMNVATTFRRGMIEWDIQSATPIAGVEQLQPLLAGTRTLSNIPTVGTWAVKTLLGVPMTNFGPAVAGSVDGATNAVVVQGTSPVLNFNDRTTAAPHINYPGWGDPGLFAGELAFTGDTANVDDNNYIIIARTKLTVTQSGDYTFNVHADDNAALRIVGQPFTQAFGLGFIDGAGKDTIFAPVGAADSNLRGSIALSPGTYDVEVLAFEGTGGSSLEVSWSPGVHTTDESIGATWSLVGNTAGSYAAPLLPATIPGAPSVPNGQWGIHAVKGAGTLNTLAEAITALGNGAATHTTGTAPVINHSDPSFAGLGGMFGGELTLPTDTAGTPTDDNDFVMHGAAKIVIATPGIYTFAMKHGENVALRIKGQRWLNVAGEFGIDPQDPGTLYTTRNSLNAVNITEFTSRAIISLQAGTYEVDVVAFDRDGGFFVEFYSRPLPANVLNTAEYVTSATIGATVTMAGDYRLVGYKGDGSLGVLGVDTPGWTRSVTTPTAATAAPSGWGGTSVANHDLWFDNASNGASADPNPQITVNDRDPQNPATLSQNTTGLPNDRDFFKNTTADDNFYVERYTAMLSVPEAGTYSIGWQGDDGGYIEVLNLPAGIGFQRIEAAALPGANLTITAATGNYANGRLQLNAGGGNTKTMARITFPNDGSVIYPASYPIRSQHYEGSGGSYWEIFASPGNGYGRPLLLLESGVSTTGGADVNGIPLMEIPGTIDVTAVSMVDGNKFSFTFVSTPGVFYTIERSTSMEALSWEVVGEIIANSPATTYTEGAATIPDQPRYFYRARR